MQQKVLFIDSQQGEQAAFHCPAASSLTGDHPAPASAHHTLHQMAPGAIFVPVRPSPHCWTFLCLLFLQEQEFPSSSRPFRSTPTPQTATAALRPLTPPPTPLVGRCAVSNVAVRLRW